MSDNEYIGFKEMCARFDVTPRTLRYYEYIELLSPRKEGRSRFYGPREIARMKLILRGRRFGFSLEDIRQWLLIYGEKGTREQYRVWIELADRQLQVLRQQRDELEASMSELLTLRNETVSLLDGMGPGENAAAAKGDRAAD
ncbi:MerR family DNA-binding transcriptional regulator [Paracoccus sp. PS-1]|uniref:MerR family transcriptional regulator n=1 Tax=unclassified Paracoccus (in: a-proteobacteria) TaxID=2688777 RepID=UPI0004B13E94|nr:MULTISPECIES: MerR family DNA-binding transcriptional regulator [unclassified Paracoccus (in: a-proteobacteria)]MDQ7263434.1 MerR family DNA-binding transcriptional regulator [Paracoccus sp. PS1]RQP05545.1 MAG: MerR family DNA-binding transcriptional regulator [Paracoccus sp. BP8]UFM66708.1 MerR family DNA-binding transcriptional regulator [Paracoccus sp. MA]